MDNATRIVRLGGSGQRECGCPAQLGLLPLVACRHIDGALFMRLFSDGHGAVFSTRNDKFSVPVPPGVVLGSHAICVGLFGRREAELLGREAPA